MNLHKPSFEQTQIINKLETNNIVVDAVAGSGKTTTNLHIAKQYSNKSILLLTYNKDLKLDSRKKALFYNLTNLETHSFHSFCVKYYYKKSFDDNGIIRVVNEKKKEKLYPIHFFDYDIIIIDEVQDLNKLYYQLICKIIKDNDKTAHLCILGDRHQCINRWNDSDWRFLKYTETLFNFNDYKWENLRLSTTFRLSIENVNFVNNCLLHSDRMLSNKRGVRPEYIICDSFNNSILATKIYDFLGKGYIYDDFFILAPSVKSGAKIDPPIRQLANTLSKNSIPIFVPNTDAEELDKRELLGKIVFSTFHQVKGRERKIVIVFNFDESYFTYYAKNKTPYECPNELYVACTRSSEHLLLVHHYQNNYLPFLALNKLPLYTNTIINNNLLISSNKTKHNFKTSVTDLTKHLPSRVMKQCLTYFTKKCIQEEGEFINIPRKIEQKYGIESVSEITGIAIPTYFEFINKKYISIVHKLLGTSLGTSLGTTSYNNEDYSFLDDSDDEEEGKGKGNNDLVNLNNLGQTMTPNTLLYIANKWNASKTGYIFKLNQINEYDWLSKNNLDMSVNRLKNKISKNAEYEVNIKLENYKELINRQLVGYIDCIDDTNVWEIKCVKVLRSEHFLQLAIYMYMYMKTTSKNFNYLLFNVLTDEIYQLNSNLSDLEEMMDYLIKFKYYNNKELTDKEFLENNEI